MYRISAWQGTKRLLAGAWLLRRAQWWRTLQRFSRLSRCLLCRCQAREFKFKANVFSRMEILEAVKDYGCNWHSPNPLNKTSSKAAVMFSDIFQNQPAAAIRCSFGCCGCQIKVCDPPKLCFNQPQSCVKACASSINPSLRALPKPLMKHKTKCFWAERCATFGFLQPCLRLVETSCIRS